MSHIWEWKKNINKLRICVFATFKHTHNKKKTNIKAHLFHAFINGIILISTDKKTVFFSFLFKWKFAVDAETPDERGSGSKEHRLVNVF